jgi:hypothetical protein
MSDELKNLENRVDALLEAVKLIHTHVKYEPSCKICQALWRAS